MKKEEERIRIEIRLSKKRKEAWKKKCDELNITLTDLIISSVEKKILRTEKRGLMSFLDKQLYQFSKVENNINQIAKIVNTEKRIDDALFKTYITKLNELNELKNSQNHIIRKVLKRFSEQ